MPPSEDQYRLPSIQLENEWMLVPQLREIISFMGYTTGVQRTVGKTGKPF